MGKIKETLKEIRDEFLLPAAVAGILLLGAGGMLYSEVQQRKISCYENNVSSHYVMANTYEDSNKRMLRIFEPEAEKSRKPGYIIAWDNGSGKFEKIEVRAPKGSALESYANPKSCEDIFKYALEGKKIWPK